MIRCPYRILVGATCAPRHAAGGRRRVSLVARRLGVSQSHLWRVLNGQRRDCHGLVDLYEREVAWLDGYKQGKAKDMKAEAVSIGKAVEG